MGPLDQLRVESIGIDGTVLLYTFAIAVATGLIFGFAPALQGSRADLQYSLKDGTRTVIDHRGHWIRKGLVVAETDERLTYRAWSYQRERGYRGSHSARLTAR